MHIGAPSRARTRSLSGGAPRGGEVLASVPLRVPRPTPSLGDVLLHAPAVTTGTEAPVGRAAVTRLFLADDIARLPKTVKPAPAAACGTSVNVAICYTSRDRLGASALTRLRRSAIRRAPCPRSSSSISCRCCQRCSSSPTTWRRRLSGTARVLHPTATRPTWPRAISPRHCAQHNTLLSRRRKSLRHSRRRLRASLTPDKRLCAASLTQRGPRPAGRRAPSARRDTAPSRVTRARRGMLPTCAAGGSRRRRRAQQRSRPSEAPVPAQERAQQWLLGSTVVGGRAVVGQTNV
jgi:hypothetical protein